MGESKTVTIDIGKYLEDPDVGKDGDHHSYGDERKGGEVTLIINENPEGLSGYKKLTHKPKEKGAKIGEVKFKDEPISGFENLLTNLSQVSVYCWIGDSDCEYPLLIQLGKDEKYYVSDDVGNYEDWGDASKSVAGDGIEVFLDEKNCEHNGAHAVDISKEEKQTYECSICDEDSEINTIASNEHGYKKVVHNVSGGYIGKFMENNEGITGIKITKKVSTAEVYWYSPQGKKKALLIHYSDSWYGRDKGDPKKWTLETTSLSSHEPRTILRHLKQLYTEDTSSGTRSEGVGSSRVTIDISYHSKYNSKVKNVGGSYSYDSKSGGKVTISDTKYPESGGMYKKIIHSVEHGSSISKIEKGGSNQNGFDKVLTGISQVSVYYWDGDINYSTPLIVQIGTENKYYVDPRSSGSWNDLGIAEPNLPKNLDIQNCLKNNVHIVDISRTSRSSICLVDNCNVQIDVTPKERNKYKKFTHKLKKGTICKLKHGQTVVTTLQASNLNSVDVYHFPVSTGRARLVYLNPTGWLKSVSKDDSWEALGIGEDKDLKLSNNDNPDKIYELLQRIYGQTSASGEEGPRTGSGMEEQQRTLQTQGTVTIDISYHPEKKPQVTEIGGFHFYIGGTGRVTIEEDKPPETPGYKRITHTPQGGTIGGINKNGSIVESFTRALTGVSKVSVYYWIGDSKYANPLIVQLGTDKRYHISLPKSDNWYNPGISSMRDLLTWLDIQNCSKNAVHVVDISRISKGYSCQASGCQVDINIESKDELDKYKKVTHTLTSGSIGRLKNSSGNITRIELSSGMRSLEVYHYPKQHNNPLLVYLNSVDEWIERTSKSETDWSALDDEDGDDDTLSDNKDSEKISARLKTLYEKTKGDSELGAEEEGEEEGTTGDKVTIDIGYYPDDGYVKYDDNNGNIFYYPENTGGKDISITLDQNINIPGFVKCTHEPKNKKIKDLQYDGDDQEGLPDPSDYKTISVYYMGDDYDNPLVLQFDNEQTYYIKKDDEDDEDENTWERSTVHFPGPLQQMIYKVGCKKIRSHAVDILKKTTSPYNCTICSQQNAISAVYTDEKEGFKKVVHTVSGGCVGKIMEDTKDVTDIPIAENISVATVYWYPTDSPKPCLIYLHYTKSTKKWYQADPDGPKKWKVPDEPPKDTNNPTVHAFLKKIWPNVESKESRETSQTHELGAGAAERGDQVGQRKEKVIIDIENVPNSSETRRDRVKNNTFYYDDGQVTIEDKAPDGFTGYNRVIHKPTSSEARIETIKYSKEPQRGFPQDLAKFQSVTVYYWTVTEYGTPLIAHLGGSTNCYYTYEDNDTWSDVSGYVKVEGIYSFLEIKNCAKTRCHVVNISEKGMESSRSYLCPSCKKENVSISLVQSPTKSQGYKYFGHTLPGSSSISGFKDSSSYQTGFKSFQGYDQANVYWYPDEEKGRPLLICIKSGSGQEEHESKSPIWYKRYPPNGNGWVLEQNGPPTEDDPKVLDLLKRITETRSSDSRQSVTNSDTHSGHQDRNTGETQHTSTTNPWSYVWKIGGPITGSGLVGFGGWYAWKTLRRST